MNFHLHQRTLKGYTRCDQVKMLFSVPLSIVKVRYDGNKVGHHYQIEKYEDFATRPFDELYEFMSIPRYKFDRSANDQIDRQHIR